MCIFNFPSNSTYFNSACRLIRVFNIFAASFEISLSCNTSSRSKICWPRRNHKFQQSFQNGKWILFNIFIPNCMINKRLILLKLLIHVALEWYKAASFYLSTAWEKRETKVIVQHYNLIKGGKADNAWWCYLPSIFTKHIFSG